MTRTPRTARYFAEQLLALHKLQPESDPEKIEQGAVGPDEKNRVFEGMALMLAKTVLKEKK